MLIFARFVCGSLATAAVALVGLALLQNPVNGGHASHVYSGAGDAVLQAASIQVDSIIRQASVQITPRLRSLSMTGAAFVRSNATTARLQFEGMANTLASDLSIGTWLPGRSSSWSEGRVEGASRSKTLALAKDMPIAKAVKANMEHVAEVHPSLNLAASGF